ncbi:hypothetical protein Hokovirus_4_7 [Hokovirus HKV1]|uniref:Uncharacterized protein n=1 Tax=Hokovirus HKV1 TaxID=1977638 RepID=A0A1V0SH47_9VIRU|nr:hypothetical protein Hokovirus_4_7 [Hokovirus HKV1]
MNIKFIFSILFVCLFIFSILFVCLFIFINVHIINYYF